MNPPKLPLPIAALVVLVFAAPAYADAITYARWFDSLTSSAGEQTTVDGPTMIDLANVDIVADFGVNRLGVTGKEAGARSAWLDQWTITGGTGTDVVAVQWSLDGTLSVTDTPACPNCDTASIQYTSLFGASSVFGGTQLYSAAQLGSGTTSVNTSGTLLFSFTYGTPFNAGFLLNGSLGDDLQSGNVDFFNSALLTAIILPAGASLQTTSTHADYPVLQATPVPEPGAFLLVAIGLTGVIRHARSRRSGGCRAFRG